MKADKTPNPAGKHGKRKVSNTAGRVGKPMSLYPLTFDEAVKGLHGAPPTPQQDTAKKKNSHSKN